MNVQNIANVLVDAKKYVPEPARVRLCFMFMHMIGDCIQEASAEAFKNWKDLGSKAFLQACQIESIPATVATDLRVKESLLSEYCNKWLNVTQFRASETEEWSPITSDMNSLRVTMVKELEELAQKSA